MHLNSFLDVGFAAQPQHRQPVDVGHGHRPIGMDVHGVEEAHCLHSLQLRPTLALHRLLEVIGSWPDHTFHKHLEVLHVGEVRRREHERGSNRERLTLHYGIIMRIRLGGLGRGIRRRTAQHLWHLLRRLRRIVTCVQSPKNPPAGADCALWRERFPRSAPPAARIAWRCGAEFKPLGVGEVLGEVLGVQGGYLKPRAGVLSLLASAAAQR